ncbi:MAG: sugar ABC transporter permease, partial [Chloroflexi bacterium]|nr:sugar ABC transporter permease [Chloroflexota bacterium]
MAAGLPGADLVVIRAEKKIAAAIQRPRRRRFRIRRTTLDGYLLIAPWALGFALFTAVPMVVSLVLAFLEWDLITPWKFNGLDNWRRLLEDDLVTTALGNTAYYTFIAVPLHVAGALGLAILLNKRMKGIGFFRTTFFLPSVTPQVAA